MGSVSIEAAAVAVPAEPAAAPILYIHLDNEMVCLSAQSPDSISI